MKMRIRQVIVLGLLMGIWISGYLALGQGINVSRGHRSDFKFQTSPANRFALSPSSPFALGQSSFFREGRPDSKGSFKLGSSFRPHSFIFGNLSLNEEHRFGPSLTFGTYPLFYGGYGLYGSPTDSQNNGVNSFLEQWRNQNPFTDRKGSGFAGSLLLSEGMQEEEVIKVMGSPIDRTSSGDSQVWKYSGFSLYFQDGKLKELR